MCYLPLIEKMVRFFQDFDGARVEADGADGLAARGRRDALRRGQLHLRPVVREALLDGRPHTAR